MDQYLSTKVKLLKKRKEKDITQLTLMQRLISQITLTEIWYQPQDIGTDGGIETIHTINTLICIILS
jgi:hypothetical protein